MGKQEKLKDKAFLSAENVSNLMYISGKQWKKRSKSMS